MGSDQELAELRAMMGNLSPQQPTQEASRIGIEDRPEIANIQANTQIITNPTLQAPVMKPQMVVPLFDFDGCDIIYARGGVRLEVELTQQNPKIWFRPGLMYEFHGPAKLDIDNFSLAGFASQLLTGNKLNLPFVSLDSKNEDASAIFISEIINFPVVVVNLALTGPLIIADNRLVAFSGNIKANIHKNEGLQTFLNDENGLYQLQLSAKGTEDCFVYLQAYNYHPRVMKVNVQSVLDRDLFLGRSPSLKYTIQKAVKGFWKTSRTGEDLVHKVTGEGLIILENEYPN